MFRSVFDMFTGVIGPLLMVIGASVLLGFLTSFIYHLIRRKEGMTRGFTITLAVLPTIVAVLVAVVNLRTIELNNNGLQVGLVLAGIFALTRFRSDPLNVEDLTYVILAFFIGVATGLGYLVFAFIGTAGALLLMIIIFYTRFGQANARERRLRFLVPEDLNYEQAFIEVLTLYCEYSHLERVKTTDFGQLFELTYVIKLKKSVSEKALIDAIRAKNANLEVSMTSRQQG